MGSFGSSFGGVVMSRRDYLVSKGLREISKGLPRAMRPFSEGGSYAGGTYGQLRRLANESGKYSGRSAAWSRNAEARIGNGNPRSGGLRRWLETPASRARSRIDEANAHLAEIQERWAVNHFYDGTQSRKNSRQYLDLLTPKKSRPNLP